MPTIEGLESIVSGEMKKIYPIAGIIFFFYKKTLSG